MGRAAPRVRWGPSHYLGRQGSHGSFWRRVGCGFLEKAMAPDSSTLAWKIPWTEEPGRLQSMGSLRVGHN